MSPVMPVSHITGGAAGGKGRGVVGEGGGAWLTVVVGWCAVNRWGGMVRAGRGECGARTYRRETGHASLWSVMGHVTTVTPVTAGAAGSCHRCACGGERRAVG